jgi:hypothetical protein
MSDVWNTLKKVGNDADPVNWLSHALGQGTNFQGGGGSSSDSGGTPSATTAAQISALQNTLKGLSVGQESNPTGGIASNFAKALAGLPADQAASLMKSLSNYGTFGTDVSNDVAGKGGPPPASSGFVNDPLNFSQYFNSTAAPWLAQQQATAQGFANSEAGDLKSAYANAPAQYQQMASVVGPEMAQAMTGLNESATAQSQAMPDFDLLISSLTGQTTAAKAAQYAAAEEPYVAATEGLGTSAGTASGNAQTAQTQAAIAAAMYQQALNGSLNASTGLGTGVNPTGSSTGTGTTGSTTPISSVAALNPILNGG